MSYIIYCTFELLHSNQIAHTMQVSRLSGDTFDMIDYKDIGKRIRTIRMECKLTQDQLAEAAGVGVTHISHIETGMGTSGRFIMSLSSVLRQGAVTPWRRTFLFYGHISRYKLELRLPFSRQRCSLEISSALHRSSRARLTVERERFSSAEIVRIPGQHLPSLSA